MVITKTAVDEVAVPVLVGQNVTVKSVYQFNNGNAVAYLQMFNAKIASAVTVGTTVPNIVVGASTLNDTWLTGLQWYFPDGLVIACTAAPTTADAPNADQLITLELG
jgi:uncharacterized radical SAM superfamily protein